MGLFCQIFHVLDVNQSNVHNALTVIMSKRGFSLTSATTIDGGQLESQIDASSAPAYIIGPMQGRWTPVIDLHAEPWPGEICTDLSRTCSTHTLCVMVHDDDVMFYNLDHCGESQDGYNSNPQYFEADRVLEPEIQSQRHTPKYFESLLPEGKTLQGLLSILNAGWWQAHDDGILDGDGVMPNEIWDAAPYQTEGERMVAFGTFLELAGQNIYPFADWRDNRNINWQTYQLLQFVRKPSLAERLVGKKK